MRIMARKGLLKVVDPRRPVKFAATVDRAFVGRQMAQDLVNRVFGGSVAELLRHALAGRKRVSADLAEIRKVLKALD